MQRLAPLAGAIILAALLTGCTFPWQNSGNPDESQYSVDRTGRDADHPADRFFEVVMIESGYDPAESWVRANTSVAFTNGGSTQHSANGDNNEFNTGGVTPQSSVPQVFTVKGDYAYRCGFHEGMRGLLHVV